MSQRAAEMMQYLARQRPRKLFNVLNKLEGHGVGRKVTRTIWRQEEVGPDPVTPCYWTITRVKPDQVKETCYTLPSCVHYCQVSVIFQD